MAGLALESIGDSVRSLGDRDVDLAGKVIDRDGEIDQFNLSIDRKCLDAFAAGGLKDGDLRIVAATYRLIGDLERIGDYSVAIARVTRALSNKPLSGIALDILKMAGIAQQMLRQSMGEYGRPEPASLEPVFAADLEIDRLYGEVFYKGLEEIIHEPGRATLAIYLIIAARALERIGDHVTDIAERIEYVKTGRLTERSVPMHVPFGERDTDWE